MASPSVKDVNKLQQEVTDRTNELSRESTSDPGNQTAEELIAPKISQLQKKRIGMEHNP